MPTKQPSKDSVKIAKRLTRIAQQRAVHHHVTFGDGAIRDIPMLAEASAARILSIPDAKTRVMAFRGAEAGFKRLVDEMVVASHELPGYRQMYPGVIGERTLDRARKKICPLFPIC